MRRSIADRLPPGPSRRAVTLVARQVRAHVQFAQIHDEVAGVVALFGAEGDRASAFAPTGYLRLDYLQRR